jgi:SAM-dependent methyltransferase
MNTATKLPTPAVLPQNEVSARTWSAGGHGYDRISRQIADAIEHGVDRLAPLPGEKVLDLATGTGWAARRIAQRGATVTGVDLGQGVIDAARELSQGYGIDFQVGDAEALQFGDDSFDALISTFGVMFAGNPEKAAAELARVVKKGGRIVLTNWATHGGVIEMFKLIQSHKPGPAPSTPSPFEWGKRERLEELLGDAFDVRVEEAISWYREPSPEAAWEAFSNGFGPVVTLLGKLDEAGRATLQRDFIAFHAKHQTEAGVLVARNYLVVVGTRR